MGAVLVAAVLLLGGLAQAPGAARDRANALLVEATQASDAGKYDEAAGLARQAIEVASGLDDTRLLAIAWNRAGLAHMYAGKYVDADHEFRTAADLSARNGDLEGRAETLGNLANVQFFLGKYSSAADLYAQALRATSEGGTAEWVDRRRRILLNNEATLYLRLGRDRDALAIYRTLTESAAMRPREEAQLLVNLGVVYRRLGDPVKALASYEKASGLFASDRDVDGELGARINRGIVLASDLVQLAEAEQAFGDALDLATRAGNRREMGHAHLYRGETRVRGGSKERAAEDFRQALAIARDLKTPEEEWKALFGLGRTSGSGDVPFLEQAVGVIEQLRENIRVPSLRVEFLNDKRAVYDALIAARLQSASAEGIFDLLERSHSRGWRERLGLPGAVPLGSVQAALPPRTLLLDYWHSASGAAVIAVTREKAAVIRIAFEPQAVTDLLDELSSADAQGWRETASRLAGLVPPGDWLRDVDHVIVIPDGAIALVPFELLPVTGGMLIERAAVSYTPTAATLLRTPRDGGWRAPWRLQLRAFADPTFATAGDSVDALPRLRAAGAEVRSIAGEIAGRSMLHVGAEDRKSYLFTPQRAPLLHLATHAAADTNAIERSRVFFSAPGGAGPAEYLFLREAYDLSLDGVELAVLSACDTERGPSTRAEGVQSFSRAFLAAGARSTVTTLWRVADRPTADFMAVFYHHLQAGATRDEALRRAKLRFLQSGTSLADPHYWAAFVLTGEGTYRVSRAVPWAYVIAAAAGLAGLAGIAIALVRQTRRRARASNGA